LQQTPHILQIGDFRSDQDIDDNPYENNNLYPEQDVIVNTVSSDDEWFYLGGQALREHNANHTIYGFTMKMPKYFDMSQDSATVTQFKDTNVYISNWDNEFVSTNDPSKPIIPVNVNYIHSVDDIMDQTPDNHDPNFLYARVSYVKHGKMFEGCFARLNREDLTEWGILIDPPQSDDYNQETQMPENLFNITDYETRYKADRSWFYEISTNVLFTYRNNKNDGSIEFRKIINAFNISDGQGTQHQTERIILNPKGKVEFFKDIGLKLIAFGNICQQEDTDPCKKYSMVIMIIDKDFSKQKIEIMPLKVEENYL